MSLKPSRPWATKTMFLMEGDDLVLWRSQGQKAAAFRTELKRRCRNIARVEGHPAVVMAEDLDRGQVLFEARPKAKKSS